MWNELIPDLARCIIALANTPADTKTVFSMADFGSFCQRCANHEGWGDEARELFRWVSKQQEGQQADTRVVLKLMTEILAENPRLVGQEMTAKQWASSLQDTIPEHEGDLKQKVQRNYFSWETKTFSSLFVTRLGMKLGWNKHLKVATYSFTPPGTIIPIGMDIFDPDDDDAYENIFMPQAETAVQ